MATQWYLAEGGQPRAVSEAELRQAVAAARPGAQACSTKTGNQWRPLAEVGPLLGPAPGAAPRAGAGTAPGASAFPVVTAAIFGVVGLVYVVEVIVAGGAVQNIRAAELRSCGANYGPSTVGGEPWRLLTAVFLHGGLSHIAGNLFTFFGFGPTAERRYGPGRFALLYLLAGLGGSMASVIWSPAVTSVGASGAIFGVIGALLAFLVMRPDSFKPEDLAAHAKSLGGCVVFNFANGLASPVIDNAAHFGGLAAGFLAGLALAPRAGGGPPGAREIGGGLGLVALLGVLFPVAYLRVTTDPRAAAVEAARAFEEDRPWLAAGSDALDALRDELVALRARRPPATSAEIAEFAKPRAARASSLLAELQAARPEHADVAAIHGLLEARAERLAAAFGALGRFAAGDGAAGAEFDAAWTEAGQRDREVGESLARLVEAIKAASE